MAKIIIPTPFRKYTQNQASYETHAPQVGAALEALGDEFPELKEHLLDEKGHLRKHITVFVGDEDIAFLKQEETVLDAQSEMSILPPLIGGLS